MASHGAVTANSLASLTALASNPPRYPRNPTQETRERLVLYIARVPGSKDVFLSTMKPSKDVVTAQDVSNSIYFLHVEQPGDDALADDLRQASAGALASRDESKQAETPVQRKPVADQGENVSPTIKSKPEFPQKQPPGNWQQHGEMEHIGRKPVGGSIASSLDRIHKEEQHAEQKMDQEYGEGGRAPDLTRRRPLGPRAEQARPKSVAMPLPGVENGPIDGRQRATTIDSPPPPELPPRKANSTSSGNVLSGSMASTVQDFAPAATRSNARSPRSHKHTTSSRTGDSTQGRRAPSPEISHGPYFIMLIRRDLASGAQWNVGRISIKPDQSLETQLSKYAISSGEGAARNVPPSRSIGVEISNPGYGKFNDIAMPSLESLMNPGNKASLNVGKDSQPSLARDGIFRRTVEREASPARTRDTRKTSLGSMDWAGDGNPFRKGSRPRGDSLQGSQQRTSSEDLDATNAAGGNAGESSRLRARGYSFRSPWDGRCDFTTGVAGRSLKCKHTLPQSNATDPAPSVTVSELRFNLPGAVKFGSLSSAGNPTPSTASLTTSPSSNTTSPTHDGRRSALFSGHGRRFSKHLAALAAHHPAAHDSGNVVRADNAEDRLDLSLGQEKAGGGHRGNSAKLGKLIVEDEGMRMLDLVVAANMGVWWTAYERARAREDP